MLVTKFRIDRSVCEDERLLRIMDLQLGRCHGGFILCTSQIFDYRARAESAPMESVSVLPKEEEASTILAAPGSTLPLT